MFVISLAFIKNIIILNHSLFSREFFNSFNGRREEMYERVIEIIAYIVNELSTDHTLEDSGKFDVLSQKLADNGYTESEINFAFSWILEKAKFDSTNETEVPLIRSHRILHDFEKLAISPGAYGYLIQLHELELIDDMEMEQIIEKALLSDSSPVSVNEMKDIVANLIFKPNDIMEGSLFLLDNTYNVH